MSIDTADPGRCSSTCTSTISRDSSAASPYGNYAGITLADVRACLGQHVSVYRFKQPYYQATMLNSLLSIWADQHHRVLDIGGGTGVIGQCISDLLPADCVKSIDVVDRFCKTLSISTGLFDGCSLPFPDASYNAAVLNNVIHHVPKQNRICLLREIRRILKGPLYIKDHQVRSRLDHVRLFALDAIGNIPFGGMVKASYLTDENWRRLARETGFRIAKKIGADYRIGVAERFFPNHLEVAMRWEPL